MGAEMLPYLFMEEEKLIDKILKILNSLEEEKCEVMSFSEIVEYIKKSEKLTIKKVYDDDFTKNFELITNSINEYINSYKCPMLLEKIFKSLDSNITYDYYKNFREYNEANK